MTDAAWRAEPMEPRISGTWMVAAKSKREAEALATALAESKGRAVIRATAERFQGAEQYDVNWRVIVEFDPAASPLKEPRS